MDPYREPGERPELLEADLWFLGTLRRRHRRRRGRKRGRTREVCVEAGPLTAEAIARLFESRILKPTQLVRAENDRRWRLLRTVPELAPRHIEPAAPTITPDFDPVARQPSGHPTRSRPQPARDLVLAVFLLLVVLSVVSTLRR